MDGHGIIDVVLNLVPELLIREAMRAMQNEVGGPKSLKASLASILASIKIAIRSQ